MRREIMIELHKDIDLSIPLFEYYMDIKKHDKISIAKKIREIFNLTNGQQYKFKDKWEALNYYMDRLAEIGVLVFQANKIDTSIMRGLSIYYKSFPVIVLNRKDSVNARIFTLFHEFVHLITKTPGICDTFGMFSNSKYSIEAMCNEVVAMVLVPEEELLDHIRSQRIDQVTWDDKKIMVISKDFFVSRDVIIGRLLTLNVIDKKFYNLKISQYIQDYLKYKKNTEEKGFLKPDINIRSQVGKLYARTIIDAYNQEIITPREASHFLSGLKIHHFDKIERWCFS
jgi:Zn-dependent peptidase ImmA (M78 family)